MLPLTPGMATTAMVDTEVTMVATTDLMDTEDTEATMVATMLDLMVMATTARDLPMRPPPLSLDPTPRPTLTRGIPTMEDMAMELTDLMDMATTLTVLTVTLTGDKK